MLLSVALGSVSEPSTLAQEWKPTTDWAEYQLEVADAKVIGAISGMVAGGRFGTLSPPKGKHLIVVTLKGSLNRKTWVNLSTGDFGAVYSGESPDPGNPNIVGPPYRVPCSAASVKDMQWALAPTDADAVVLAPLEAGPITVSLAFAVPEEVTTIFVLHTTYAKGKAAILSPVPRKSTPAGALPQHTVAQAPSFSRRTSPSVSSATAPAATSADDETRGAIERIRSSRHTSMPEPNKAHASGPQGQGMTIENKTPHSLWVYFNGPVSRTVEVTANASIGVELAVGQYEVAAEIGGSDIVPFYGKQSYDPNAHYWLTFQVAHK